MKQFTTAVREAEEAASDEEQFALEFEVDGRTCKAYRPTEGQFALLMVALQRHSSNEDMVAGVVNFIDRCLDEPSSKYLMTRLMDRGDKFDLPDLENIAHWMIEEWTARPTQEPSGSTQSPSTTGSTSSESTSAQAS